MITQRARVLCKRTVWKAKERTLVRAQCALVTPRVTPARRAMRWSPAPAPCARPPPWCRFLRTAPPRSPSPSLCPPWQVPRSVYAVPPTD